MKKENFFNWGKQRVDVSSSCCCEENSWCSEGCVADEILVSLSLFVKRCWVKLWGGRWCEYHCWKMTFVDYFWKCFFSVCSNGAVIILKQFFETGGTAMFSGDPHWRTSKYLDPLIWNIPGQEDKTKEFCKGWSKTVEFGFILLPTTSLENQRYLDEDFKLQFIFLNGESDLGDFSPFTTTCGENRTSPLIYIDPLHSGLSSKCVAVKRHNKFPWWWEVRQSMGYTVKPLEDFLSDALLICFFVLPPLTPECEFRVQAGWRRA